MIGKMVIESTSEGIWRSGNLLVMRKGAQLPDRCVKTNQPAYGKRLKLLLQWHPLKGVPVPIRVSVRSVVPVFLAFLARKQVVTALPSITKYSSNTW